MIVALRDFSNVHISADVIAIPQMCKKKNFIRDVQ
jgi:hypothetical protein